MRWGGGEMREILTFACFLKFGLRKFCFMCYFWLRSWVAGLQSTHSPCSVTQVAGHRTSDTRSDTGELDTRHRTPNMRHRTSDTRHWKSAKTKTKTKSRIQFLLMPDVMSGVQYPVSDVQCPVSDFRCPVSIIGGSVTFLPDTGHRTIPSNLALCQGGLLCNPVG